MTLARSYLYAPGDRPRLLRNALSAGADAVVFDLEDSVHPSNKALARRNIVDCLASVPEDEVSCEIWVRINSLHGEVWREDVESIASPRLTGLRVPKLESAAQLSTLEDTLAELEARRGLEPGRLRLICNVESAAGLFAVPTIAGQPRVQRLAFGAADFVADLGALTTETDDATMWARSMLVCLARAAGLAPPIAPPYTRLGDPMALETSCRKARAQGFYGCTALHPNQLAVIHRVFCVEPSEIQWAWCVLAEFENAQAQGRASSISADGQFVGPPIVKRARNLLALAQPEQIEVARGLVNRGRVGAGEAPNSDDAS